MSRSDSVNMVLFVALIISATLRLCDVTTTESPYAPKIPKIMIQRKEQPFTSESFIDPCYYDNPFALFVEDSLKRSGSRGCYFCLCQFKDSAYCFERTKERCRSLHYYHPYLRYSRYGSMRGRQRYKRNADDEQYVPKMLVVRKVPTPFATCQPLTSKPYSIGCPPDDWCKGCVTCKCTNEKTFTCYRISYCAGDENKAPSLKLIEKHL